MKYVACYCRVSHEEQVKYGLSVQAQKDALEKYCKENGYKYEFFMDEGISASSMKKRKALNAMLGKADVFDMILFTKLDRFSRNVLDANNMNKTLKENNCVMKAIDEDDIDTSTADGTFLFNLKVSLAQREIEKTSERINFVFANKRERGEVTSGTKKYGYDIVDKRYVINQAEAKNIINLYKEFINNNGNLKETYKYFIQHFSGKGYDAMSNYLRDTSYIGKYKLYRKDIYIDNYIPAILDNELFEKVQILRKKKTVERKKVDDLFSGLLYCSQCKNRLAKKVDYRSKNIVVRYICDNNYRFKVGLDEKRCYNNMSIKEVDIEKCLLENLSKEAAKYIEINTIKKVQQKNCDNSAKIKLVEKKLLKLKDLYIDDLIDKTEYKKDYERYSKELTELKSIPNNVIQKDFTYLSSVLNSNYLNIYQKLTKVNKKRFWISIIDKIYIKSGKIKEITFL